MSVVHGGRGLTPEQVGRAYDAGAASYDERASSPVTVARFSRVEAMVIEQTSPQRDVLELGVGTGRLLGACAGRRRVGIDVSAGLLDHAHRKELAVARADAHRLPFADRSFDIVCAGNGVFRYLDPPVAFAEAHRVLRPGGLLFVHSYARVTWRWRRSASSELHIDDPLELIGPARTAGLVPLRVERWRPVRFPPYIVKIPARLPGRWWSHLALLLQCSRGAAG